MTDELSQAEMSNYQEEGKKQLYADPDFEQRLAARAKEGFDVHKCVPVVIVKRRRPDIQRYLSTEEGKPDLRALLNVAHSEKRSMETLDKIIARFDRHKPFEEYRPELSDTDKWINSRRGKRRR